MFLKTSFDSSGCEFGWFESMNSFEAQLCWTFNNNTVLGSWQFGSSGEELGPFPLLIHLQGEFTFMESRTPTTDTECKSNIPLL